MVNKHHFSIVGEIVLGILFVISGFGKMINAHGELISSYGLDWLSILAPFIILVELFVGFCLLLRYRPRLFLLVSGILLLVFTIAYSYANLINGIEDCGCFGDIETELPVWATYIRNVTLLILVCLLWKCETGKGNNAKALWKSWSVFLCMIICSFWTGTTWSLSTFYANRFAKTHPLIGVQFNETPLENYFQVSSDSTYLVWVFSYGCASCVNSVENIKQYQTGVADCFYAFTVSEDKGGKKRKLLDIPFETTYVGEEFVGFIKTIPTLLYIKEGKIKYVIENGVPNVYLFKSIYLEMSEDEMLKQRELLI